MFSLDLEKNTEQLYINIRMFFKKINIIVFQVSFSKSVGSLTQLVLKILARFSEYYYQIMMFQFRGEFVGSYICNTLKLWFFFSCLKFGLIPALCKIGQGLGYQSNLQNLFSFFFQNHEYAKISKDKEIELIYVLTTCFIIYLISRRRLNSCW